MTTPQGTLQFSAAMYIVNENGGSALITVTRTGGSAGAVGVTFKTSDGTATAGSDYTATTQTINFADGDMADKSLSIPILDDAVYEGNETVNLTLSTPTGGATLGSPSTAVLTIVENDALLGPDLTGAITGLRCRPGGTQDRLLYLVRISNMGTEATGGSFRVSFFLSNDGTLDEGDLRLGSREVTQSLPPGGGVSLFGISRRPHPIQGQFLLAQIDAEDTIEESNEGNNLIVSQPIPCP